MSYAVGEVIEVKDSSEQWCEAQLLQLDPDDDEALVRFKATTSSCDEWVPFNKIRKFTGLSSDKRESRQKFKVGECVMAKWLTQVKPYPAKVLGYDISTDSYEIKFYDGFVKTYKSTRIQKMTRADRERLALDPPPPAVLEPINKSVFDTSGIGTKEDRRVRKRKIDVIGLFRPNARAHLEDERSDRSDSPSSQVSTGNGRNRKRARTTSQHSVETEIAGPSRRNTIVPIPVPLKVPQPTASQRRSYPLTASHDDLEKASRRERSKKFSVADLFLTYKKTALQVEATDPRTYSKYYPKPTESPEKRGVRLSSPRHRVSEGDVADLVPLGSHKNSEHSPKKRSSPLKKSRNSPPRLAGLPVPRLSLEHRSSAEVCVLDDKAEFEGFCGEEHREQLLVEHPTASLCKKLNLSDKYRHQAPPSDAGACAISNYASKQAVEARIEPERAADGHMPISDQPIDSLSDDGSDIIILSDDSDPLLEEQQVVNELNTEFGLPVYDDIVGDLDSEVSDDIEILSPVPFEIPAAVSEPVQQMEGDRLKFINASSGNKNNAVAQNVYVDSINSNVVTSAKVPIEGYSQEKVEVLPKDWNDISMNSSSCTTPSIDSEIYECNDRVNLAPCDLLRNLESIDVDQGDLVMKEQNKPQYMSQTMTEPVRIANEPTFETSADVKNSQPISGLPPKAVRIQQIIVKRDFPNKSTTIGHGQRIQNIEVTAGSTGKKPKVPDEIFLQDMNLPEGWMKRATRCFTGAKKWSVILIGPCGTKFYARKAIAAYLDAKGLSYPMSLFNFALGVDFIRQFGGSADEMKKEKRRSNSENQMVSKPISKASEFLPTAHDFVCPGRMCNKSFRSALLLHMHIKHQHPDLSKADIVLPKVSELAYARMRDAGEDDSTKGKGDLPPVSCTAQFQNFLSKREETIVREVSAGNENDEFEASSMVVEAVEENEDLVHCICGYNEEDGLMIQCDVCLCWQHGVCFGILTEEEVSDRYTCSYCLNPKKVRATMRVAFDENWLRDGKIARFSFVDKKNEKVNPKRISTLRRAHLATAESLEIGNFLHKLSKKIEIAKNKNHPKLHLWARGEGVKLEIESKKEEEREEDSSVKFDELTIPTSQESTDFLMEDLPEDAFDGSFLENSDISSLLPTSSELEQMSEELGQKDPSPPTGVPQAEVRINNEDCHQNLLLHIKESHSVVEHRLELLEKLADILEKDTANTEVASRLQELIKDVTELRLLSSFS